MRSLWKGLVFDPKIKRKFKYNITQNILNNIQFNPNLFSSKKKKSFKQFISTTRNRVITPKLFGLRVWIHSGNRMRIKKFTNKMANKKFGEFLSTRKIK